MTERCVKCKDERISYATLENEKPFCLICNEQTTTYDDEY